MHDDLNERSHVSLLDSVDEETRANIMAAGRERQLKRGEILFHHGDDGEEMVITLDGTLKVFLTSLSGREIVLDYLGTGQMRGEMTLFSKQPPTASVAAAEPSRHSFAWP